MSTLPGFVHKDPEIRPHTGIYDPCIRCNPRNLLEGGLVSEDTRVGFLACEDDAIGTTDSERGETLANSSEGVLYLGEFSGGGECC
jgi:hypothetical protein